jgi:hypothetical protein
MGVIEVAVLMLLVGYWIGLIVDGEIVSHGWSYRTERWVEALTALSLIVLVALGIHGLYLLARSIWG